MNKSSSKQLIINADDFGLTPGASAGILYAHRHGILTSTTAMVNTAFSKQSLTEAKSYPDLGIGLHFVLDAGRPIFSHNSSLTDHRGHFLKGRSLIDAAKTWDIKDELKAQLELLHEWYGNVTHIDSHHHMHLHIPDALEAVIEVAERYQLPVRTFSETAVIGKGRTTDYFHYDFYGEENVSVAYLLAIFSNIKPGTTEVMCHPAFLDAWLRRVSSYDFTRMKELEILVDNKVQEWLNDHSIHLIHYGGLHHGH
ncbi:ChbG/HpnK family deacetylase [Virgibacillus sp. NKC19-3]|uniref:ChbG/HpnK family deacetylase n=1 Tax=Virgibacillus saliphilus TaxID=2831674 RepID=UPI001C9AEA8D|nr:ChbG/HpnK family deacetylase [Virgibacillus sp. NKC19-3]MBY7144357.1 ChbG/HpnK family deacetylase [Virgibacillus sp. NKC19-3]